MNGVCVDGPQITRDGIRTDCLCTARRKCAGGFDRAPAHARTRLYRDHPRAAVHHDSRRARRIRPGHSSPADAHAGAGGAASGNYGRVIKFLSWRHCTMTLAAFDTHKFVRTLKGAGFNEKQAEALTDAVRESQAFSEVATKSDLRELELRIEAKFANVDGELKFLKWILGFIAAGVASLVLKAFF